MLSMLIGGTIGGLYFTYKPLLKHLKENKYSISAFYKSIKENPQVREEFKSFSITQMKNIQNFISKFTKEKKEEETKQKEAQEQEQTHTENTQEQAQEQTQTEKKE
ncbi:MAG: hypothetical protein IJ950_03325 [Helicobacter sp.]|nr:hypothetical protein [Helicobacter sp.]